MLENSATIKLLNSVNEFNTNSLQNSVARRIPLDEPSLCSK
jgi:hypothetical protein